MADPVEPTPGQILDALRTSKRGPLKAKDLARELGVDTPGYKRFRRALAELQRKGQVYRVKGGRYAVPDKINLVAGTLSTVRSGDGFVAPDDGGRDVYVPAADLGSAMDGDRVVARIEARPRGRNAVGRIIKVLERAHPTMVGTYHRARRFGYVVPQDRKVMKDILIPQGEDGDARHLDVVVAEVTSYGDAKLNPVGRVIRVLGGRDEPGVDILSIIYAHGLPLEFPDDVESEAEQVAKTPIEPDEKRVDRRELLVFTIDPADAKDHDDALSIESVGKGLWEVGIHIADVSRYVETGSKLDAEAFARGTSVYLVDRVVPMLPHVLSSEVCSLRPDEDRLAVSLFAVLDERGQVRAHRFERTVIRSRHKLAYEQAQEVMDGKTSIDGETDLSIKRLDALARVLRRRRHDRGSIDFDLPEARVVLGSEGDPIDIRRVLRLESHRLIEDFMLLANEIVATECEKKKVPVLYRIHEPPAAAKLEGLREFLAGFGHSIPMGEVHPSVLQKLLERVAGRPEENLVSKVLLRSMMRARYSASNLGHFGLAAEKYCHFTSPIRRYPDLVTHRGVVRALVEGRSVPEGWAEDLEAVADRSSEREQLAATAERDSVELKKIEFMERHLGDEFAGTVSGVTAFGFYVLLDDFFVEGLVHVNALKDDYYEFRDEEYSLVGSRRGRRFRLGDRVRVEVARLDKVERHIDFVLVEAPGTEGGRGSQVEGRGRGKGGGAGQKGARNV
jgi:ribonuclease R